MAGRGDWRAAQCVSPGGKRGEEPGGGGSPCNSSPQPGPAVSAPAPAPVPLSIAPFLARLPHTCCTWPPAPGRCERWAAPVPAPPDSRTAGERSQGPSKKGFTLRLLSLVVWRLWHLGPGLTWSRTSGASILFGRVVAAADWEPAASPAQFPVAGETVSSYCTPPPPRHAAPHWLCSTRTSSTGLRVSNWRQDPKNRSASYTKKRSTPPYAGLYSLLGMNQQSSYQNAAPWWQYTRLRSLL